MQTPLLKTKERSCCCALSYSAENSTSCSASQTCNILLHNTDNSTSHKAMTQLIVSRCPFFVSNFTSGNGNC